jgi:putative DNA primase/helicase
MMGELIDFETLAQSNGAAPLGSSPPRLRAIGLSDFLAMEFPPRRMLLAPWLPMGGLAMLFAPRGVGKTHIALEVGYAVATSSSFLRWRAPEPHPVLLIDGEMPASTLQERLSRISARYGVEPPSPESLRIVASDLHCDGLPDLSDFEAQGRYDEVLGDAKLIIVDNISTLCRSGRDNDAESWTPVQEWALARRREGRAVLFVHHAGKGGTQRGTSRKEDVLDTVIALRRPEDYKASEGARFEVHFEKTRGFTGPDAEPFEATLNEAGWDTRGIEDVLDGRVWVLHQQGVKQRDIAQEVGKSLATVNRIIKRLEALA